MLCTKKKKKKKKKEKRKKKSLCSYHAEKHSENRVPKQYLLGNIATKGTPFFHNNNIGQIYYYNMLKMV